MNTSSRRVIFAAIAICFSLCISNLWAQSAGNSRTGSGTVTDATGAILTDATVSNENAVSASSRTTKSDSAGHYQFTKLPLNPYHVVVSAKGFASNTQDVDLRSFVPITLKSSLTIGTESTVIEVTGSDLVESDSTFHTDVDRGLFVKMPLESQSSSLSSLVTLASPGVAADSNGLFHGLGDHASNSFSVDGQPITDQQSKVF